jgi:phenylacetic acid degradation operon negative regulatory protein
LRKEDWLESTKFGRESHYRLTNKGRKLSREAAPRIYERALDHPRWLSLYDPAVSTPDGLRILSGMSLVEREHKGAMNIALEHPLPQWMVDRLVDQDVQIGAKKLQQRLQTVAQISDLSDLDRVVLRLSIVHEWRRIILRIPDVPDQVLANGIPIKELRQGVQQLLASVSDVTLDYIDRASKS